MAITSTPARAREGGERVVAVPVERVAVVPQLHEHAVAAERGDEPVELATCRGGAVGAAARAAPRPAGSR